MSTVDIVEILCIVAIDFGLGFYLGWWWRGDKDEHEFRKWKIRHYKRQRRNEQTAQEKPMAYIAGTTCLLHQIEVQ